MLRSCQCYGVSTAFQLRSYYDRLCSYGVSTAPMKMPRCAYYVLTAITLRWRYAGDSIKCSLCIYIYIPFHHFLFALNQPTHWWRKSWGWKRKQKRPTKICPTISNIYAFRSSLINLLPSSFPCTQPHLATKEGQDFNRPYCCTCKNNK